MASPAAFSLLYIYNATFTCGPACNSDAEFVDCGTQQYPTGGGFDVYNTNMTIVRSSPGWDVAHNVWGWYSIVQRATTDRSTVSYTFWAICAQ
jgi:hypothetical protein